MDYGTICHRAFYDPQSRGEYAGCRMSFIHYESNDTTVIYSYSTAVARVVRGLNGDKYTLISDYGYSATTRKHLACIRYASPHTLIHVPDCETGDLKYTFKQALERWTMENNTTLDDFKQADTRHRFLNLLGMFDYYQEKIGGLDDLLPLRNGRLFTTFEILCHDLSAGEMSRKECFAKARENYNLDEQAYQDELARKAKIARDYAIAQKRKRTIRTKKALAAIAEFNASKAINSMLLQEILSPLRYDLSMEVRKQLEDMRNELREVYFETMTGTRRASYVFVDKEHNQVNTSQECPVTIPTVKRLLTMWKNKQNIVGEDCDRYRVVANNKEYVQVGCHVIPLWNVQMLYNELIAA